MAGKDNPKPQQEKIIIKPDTNISGNQNSGKIKLPDLGNFEKAQNRWDFQDTSTPIKKSAIDSMRSAGNTNGNDD